MRDHQTTETDVDCLLKCFVPVEHEAMVVVFETVEMVWLEQQVVVVVGEV
jgi:hypothetical protein